MEQTADLRKYLLHGASHFGLSLSDRQISQFIDYYRELVIWSAKINLTAIKAPKDIAVKHFVDSLACSKAFDPSEPAVPLLDIGSGAGFPGLPLKILYPHLSVTLLEPNQKKTAFLRHIIGTLELTGVHTVSLSVNALSRHQDHQERYASIVTRAVNVQSVMPWIEPLLADGGRVILCRARSIELELKHDVAVGRLAVKQEISYDLPYGAGTRVLTILQKHVPRGTCE